MPGELHEPAPALDPRVVELFLRLCDASAVERSVVLGGVEPGVAEQVRRLLAADRDAGSILGTADGVRQFVDGWTLADAEGSADGTTLLPGDADPNPAPRDSLPTAGPALALPDTYSGAERLGQGGMGEVFRVRDADLQRSVALKTVRQHRGRTADGALDRFLREARMTAGLQHPGVIAIHALGVLPDGRPFYTMPEIRGDELAVRIRAHHETGTPGLKALIRVLHRATEPLAHAHAHGVVHRDLKPENLMIGAHGEVLVLDWGIARRSGTVAGDPGDCSLADESRLTQTGGVLGTPAYMAPEQIRGGALTPRTDVYALGGILYEILNGRPPRSGSIASVLDQVLRGAPIPESAGPHALIALVDACMAVEPGERPADAAEVGAALEAWLDGSERAAEADGS
ncbi:MAG: serine/threonine-protein kinase [Myxococcota bacterium]